MVWSVYYLRLHSSGQRFRLMHDKQFFEDCADRFKALAEPTRLEIVQYLVKNQSSVTALGGAIGIDIVKASHHLNILRTAGMVTAKKSGRESYYQLAPGVAKIDADGVLTINVGCFEFVLPAR